VGTPTTDSADTTGLSSSSVPWKRESGPAEVDHREHAAVEQGDGDARRNIAVRAKLAADVSERVRLARRAAWPEPA
jgi:hypothetical protein